MPQHTSVLVELLEKTVSNRGVLYLAAKRAVKRYIDEVGEASFRGDVEVLTDDAQIGQLLSVGLRRWQLDLLAEAKERRGDAD